MSDCSLPDQTLPEESLSVVHTSASDRPNRYPNRRWLLGLGAVGLLLAVSIPLVQSRLAAQEAESAETSTVNILAVETLTVPEFDKKEVLKERLRVTLKVLNSKHLSHVFESSAPRPDPNLLRR